MSKCSISPSAVPPFLFTSLIPLIYFYVNVNSAHLNILCRNFGDFLTSWRLVFKIKINYKIIIT